jgi:hypothetical protein
VKSIKALLIAVVALAALASSPPVSAQNGGSSVLLFAFGVPAGGKLVSETHVPIRVAGQLAVAFHGDVATGCAAAGLCGYSGTIVFRPRSGDLAVETYRRHDRIGRQAFLSLGPSVGGYGGDTIVSDVERAVTGQPAGLCADAEAATAAGGPSATVRGRALTIALLHPGGMLMSTRCAGPLDGDLAGASPKATISLRAALRGRTVVSLKDSNPFASHGFAGTVSSTLVLTLGKPSRPSSGSSFRGVKTERMRIVPERLSLARRSGQLSGTVRGATDPIVCRLLDSCGVSGTLGLALPGAGGAVGELIATGPASQPYGDFLTALGLMRGAASHGIAVAGSIAWAKAGSVNTDLTQPTTCSDQAPLGQLFVSLIPNGASGGFFGSTPWRTRCPGPMVPRQAQLLSASSRLRIMGSREFGVTLRPVASFRDDGYTLTLHGRVSLVLRRGQVTQQVVTEPAG